MFACPAAAAAGPTFTPPTRAAIWPCCDLLDPPAGLAAVKRGDGANLRKGQFVLCLANPYAAGFRDGSPSASWGIISNLHRRASGVTGEIERPGVKPTLHHYGTLIQTDVRLALGCSGGALLNLDGELIGLTSARQRFPERRRRAASRCRWTGR